MKQTFHIFTSFWVKHSTRPTEVSLLQWGRFWLCMGVKGSICSSIRKNIIIWVLFCFSFFVVEDHILHVTQGLVTRTYTDELWNMALSKIIAVLRTHSVSEKFCQYCSLNPLTLELYVFKAGIATKWKITPLSCFLFLVIKNCSDLGGSLPSFCFFPTVSGCDPQPWAICIILRWFTTHWVFQTSS